MRQSPKLPNLGDDNPPRWVVDYGIVHAKGSVPVTKTAAEDERLTYQISVRGKLDDRWSDWFSGLELSETTGPAGTPATILTGTIDQPALRGIVNRVWDLNLTLVSIITVEKNV